MNSLGQHARLFELLDAVCEERASADEIAELEALLRASAEARWTYLTYIDLHGSLLWDAAGGLGVLPTHASQFSRSAAGRHVSRARHWGGLAVTCAAICLAAWLGIWLVLRDQNPGQVAGPHQQPSSSLPATVVVDTPARPTPERSPVRLPAAPPASSADVVADVGPAVAVPPTAPEPRDLRPVIVGGAGSQQRVIAHLNELLRSDWQRLDVTLAPTADDSEWVRRAYLDLVGRIPTVGEAEAFLADVRRDKRERLVETLLDSGEYARNFTTIWSRLLVGRSPNPNVNRPSLQKYLRMNFAANRPWNEMVAELISAEGRTDENGAANFLVAHLNNQAVPATAITARLFLCTQIQCAQCHNHPFNDMRQTAFWEFNSLFQQTDVLPRSRREPGRPMGPPVAELISREEGGPIYYETTTGLMKAAFPRFNGSEVDPGPQVNRRRELARLMTAGDNLQLAAALVNRLWSHFLGAGFTHPVDDMGPHNPPSHPEVLAFLSEEFVRSGHDVKQLIRWICGSEAYSLSSRHPERNDELSSGEPVTFRQAYIKPMTAEQLYDSLVTATQAHLAGARDWTTAEAQRAEWLERFVVSLENDENDEAETLVGTHAQALMLMNGELMAQALSLAPGTFLGDLMRDRGSEVERIRKLCLAALSRPPSAKELPAMQKLVRNSARTSPARAAAGYQDLFWALLNSNEFALVH